MVVEGSRQRRSHANDHGVSTIYSSINSKVFHVGVDPHHGGARKVRAKVDKFHYPLASKKQSWIDTETNIHGFEGQAHKMYRYVYSQYKYILAHTSVSN